MRAAPAVAALRPSAGRVARVAPAPAETSHPAQHSVAPLLQPGIEAAPAPAQPLTQRRAAAALAPPRPAWLLAAAPGQPLSAAALQARAPDPATAKAAPAPTLHVTIDRIEVRAAVASPKPVPAPRQPKAPAVSLADYLRAGVGPKVSQ